MRNNPAEYLPAPTAWHSVKRTQLLAVLQGRLVARCTGSRIDTVSAFVAEVSHDLRFELGA